MKKNRYQIDRMSMEEAVQEVIEQCFWGDYTITAKDILERVMQEDWAAKRHLFSKIVENSLHPSRHARALFSKSEVARLLEEYPAQTDQRRMTRIRLMRANVLDKKEDIPEYSWQR